MTSKATNRVGFWSGILAFGATTAYVLVQVLQVIGILSFPADEILIYGTSLCIVIPFLLAILALHYVTPLDKKLWSHAALLFTTIYSIFVTANYVVQLATVIPMKINGTAGDIGILEQTPHSLFWDFDALGYIFMGLAMLVALPVFEKHGFQKWVRISFLANVMVTPLIAVVYFYPVYSEKLLFLGFPWAITAPLAMLMLALYFKRRLPVKNVTRTYLKNMLNRNISSRATQVVFLSNFTRVDVACCITLISETSRCRRHSYKKGFAEDSASLSFGESLS